MAKKDGMTTKEALRRIDKEGITSITQTREQLAERYKKIDKKVKKRAKEEYDGTESDTTRAIRNTMQWMGFKPAMTDDECETRIIQFFTQCAEDAELPSVEKLALVLGVSLDTMKKWENGSQGRRRQDMLAKARMSMASIDTELVQMKKIPEVSYIFRSKVHYGYRESTEVVVTSGRTEASAEELLKQAELLPDALEADFSELPPNVENKAQQFPVEEMFDGDV